MPPVAIAAAVVAGAGAAFAGATLATAVAIASVAFSVTAALTTKTPSFDSYASPQERKQVLRAAAAPKLAIYGEVMGSGVLFFAEEQPGEQDQDELLHMCIAIAGHEIDGIGQIYLNDEPVESFGQYVTWELHNNRQVADPFLLANCPSWSSDMIGKGIAFLRISLKFSADKFPNGIPNIKLVKRGYKVLDPRTGTTAWSANSALVYLHYLKNFCDVKDADILLEQFKSCANICDELVSTSAGTGVRYRTHGEFDFNESRTKVMEALLLSCAGDRVYTGGKHGMMVGAYQGPATLELHSRQVIGDIQITPEAAERDRFNTYKGKFINAKEKWAESDFPPVRVAEWVTQDGKEISKDIDFRFVTNEFQAQRICSIKMRRTRVGSILQVPMNYSGFSYRPGMNIKVFIPELAIEGVEYRVDSWSFSVLGGVKLILIQDNVQMYGDIPGQAVFQPPITNLPSSGPPAPSNLRYTARPVGDVVQGLLSWGNFGNQVADNVVTIYRAGVLQYSVRTPANECILSGLAVGTYEARVQAIAANGVGSPISTLSFTIAVPAAPNSITFIPANWSLQLIPNFSTQLSFGTICEFFYSEVNIPIEQVEATAFKLGMGTTLMHSGLTPNTTYYYWVRSVNAYGKSAFFAASGKTSYDAASILDILDGEIGAEHLREELRKPIADIPGISDSLSELGSALTALDQREQDVKSLLENAQNQLGENYVNVSLVQEHLRQRIDRYNLDFSDFRDAVFSVNPTTGEITMDAVNAVRSELGAEITAVSQHLDAVEGIVNTCVTRAELSADLERLTVVEQQIDGINGTLSQTVTKSEIDELGNRVTQVSQTLDATNATLTQKAAKSELDAQGQRLTAAEQQLSVNTSASEANAQRIDQVKAELQQADATLSASITELSQAVATENGAQAQRLTSLEALTAGNSAAISELQQVVTGDGSSLASKFEGVNASVDIAAEAEILGALGAAAEATRQRQASGQIRREQKVMVDQQQALAQTVDLIQVEYQAADASLTAQILETKTAMATADEALAQQQQVMRVEYAAGDQANSAAIQSEATARANADSTLSQWVDTVQAKVNSNTTAVQTVATAQANTAGQVEAGWYTKAQINGEGGGFGLSVEMNADGTVLSSFVVDADVFAVLSRAGGVGTKRHPFIIKNGTVYMNHALMDTAEIGNVIAKYIKVTDLSAVNIENSQFKGGNAGFGPGGPYSAWGEGWHTIIYSDGRIYTNKLYADAGSFTGEVNANSGTLNNVTIRENCIVLGTVYADRIVGDVAAIKSLYMQQPSGPFSMFFNVAAANFTRGVIVTGINIKAEGYDYGSGGGPPSQGTRTCTAVFYMNGVEFGRESVSATGRSRKDSATASATVTLPAGVRGQFQVSILDDVSASLVGAVAMVFKHGSATFE